MNRNVVVDSEVDICISDPWEFGTENGCGPFQAVIVDMAFSEVWSHEVLFVHLSEALEYKGMTFDLLVASARHGSTDQAIVGLMRGGGDMPANFLPVPIQREDGVGPMEFVEQWRGWGLIGSIHRR